MRLLYFTILFTLIYNVSFGQQKNVPVTNGVSLELANARSALLKNIQYHISLTVPQDQKADIVGHEIISFELAQVAEDLQLDFKQAADHVRSIAVNKQLIKIDHRNEHIVIAKSFLKKGINNIEINFIAGNESLNRNAAYLYALFVPDHARQTFPCFDQPDLKAKFELGLTVPKDWTALSNGKLKNKKQQANQSVFQFANSELLPTYLFSFTVGKYTDLTRTVGNRKMEFLHRETDSNKIDFSVDSIFNAHSNALDFLEDYTQIPYPFQKIGFVSIPDFQFGGMEHPGEVQYKASSLFFDNTATKDQFISRANLISHETAHMWFGDLVTMKWFNDVWMKEVFANFMADKVTEKMMGSETFSLKFLQDHYPAAYGVDRTLGANPIRQELDNLQEAGTMYGNIIYHKAPIMMRQLELLMGKDDFQKGIREYLKAYAYRNATWNDLIAILSRHTKADLYQWNKVWVNLPGRPVFEYDIKYEGNKISSLSVKQQSEMGETKLWPQTFSITLYYPNSTKILVINSDSQEKEIVEAKGLGKPLFILFNSDALGYGLFPVDQGMGERMFRLEKPLERASAYINAYEAMLSDKSFTPTQLLEIFKKGIGVEQNEMNLRMLTNYMGSIYWNFIKPAERIALSGGLENLLWDALQKETAVNNKKILFKTYQDIYQSKAAAERIYEIWKNQQAPTGMRLSEDDYTSLAFTLALKSNKPTDVLTIQRDRIKNEERKNRITFLLPALSTKVDERTAFFNSLKERKNRTKEAWVANGLAYLNHPLRQETSIAYLPASLEILEEIQRTGDIFFPQSWLSSVFGSYQTPEAYKVATDFLKQHTDYNLKLKAKILQATDHLYRAQRLVK